MAKTDTQEPAAVWVSTDDLHPWESNPRDNAKAIAEVAKSIRRFGWGAPIVANKRDGEIIAGHTRFAAAKKLGLDRVPVRWLDLDPADAHALALADNKVGEIATWDDATLGQVLRDLRDADATLLADTGFSDEELARLLGEVAPTVLEPEDEPAEVDERGPVHSVLGEVYELGPHRLICGSCREFGDVEKLLNGTRINLAFTSPPYASQRTYDESSGFTPIPPDEYVEWFSDVQANVRAFLEEDGSWFVNIKAASDGLECSLYVHDLVIAHARQWGWRFATEFCWERTGIPGKPARRFKNQFEPVFQFAVGEWKFRPEEVQHDSDSVPSYSSDNHWSHGLKSSQGTSGKGWKEQPKAGKAYPGNRLPPFATATEGGHSAAFPVGLPDFFVRAYTDQGDTVFDPFMGSGTTMIAAAQNKRVAYGCEISPIYCDVIRRRWTRFAKANNLDAGSGALDG